MTFMYVIPEPRRLGAALRAERRQRAITQADLAHEAGVSRAWLIKFEQGHDTADVGAIFRVINALGLSMMLDRKPVPTAEQQAARDAYASMFDD